MRSNLLAALTMTALVVGGLQGSAVSQETKAETIASIDFSENSKPAYVYGYPLGGYGISGEDGNNQIPNDQFKFKAEITEAGEAGAGAVATLDSSNVKLPDDASYDYMGCACGIAVELKEPWKQKDLSGYWVAFDAKTVGTKTLGQSKAMMTFRVPDDELEKDEDSHDDIVLHLVKGEADGTDTFAITNEFQTFSFALKDMNTISGSVDNFDKLNVKRISLVVQAQGSVSDFGTDDDNQVIVDNFRLIKK